MTSILERLDIRSRENVLLEEIKLPKTTGDRENVLMHLVNVEKQVTRSQIDRMAELFREDQENGVVRSVSEVWKQVVRDEGGNASKKILRDPVLKRVSLSYDKTEDTLPNGRDPNQPIELTDPGYMWMREDDIAAGIGPQRPLVKELYSLYQFGYLRKSGGTQNEIFTPSGPGETLSRWLVIIYEHNDWPKNMLVQIGKNNRHKAVYSQHGQS